MVVKIKIWSYSCKMHDSQKERGKSTFCIRIKRNQFMYEWEIIHHDYLLSPGGYSRTKYREGHKKQDQSWQKQHLYKKILNRMEVCSVQRGEFYRRK